MKTIKWSTVPNTLNKEQFYKLCGISKKTALFLLQSGKVPCVTTGKKTRCYLIRKEDVKVYLRDREVYPEFYKAASGWYSGKTNSKRVSKRVSYIVPDIDSELLKFLPAFFTELLKDEPDVMTVADIHSFTGYSMETVKRWIRRGHLKSFHKGKQNLIPKVFLVEYLCSGPFRTILRKTPWHVQSIQRFPLWVHCKMLNDAASEPQEQGAS